MPVNLTKQQLYGREYREKNREVINRNKKEWWHTNKERLLKAANNYVVDNYEKILFNQVKCRARKYNIDFDLELKDIKIPDVCPLLNLPITRIRGEGRVDTNPSLDRVDNSKGYTKDNIQVISFLANRMKNSASKEQLITFSKNILEFYGI